MSVCYVRVFDISVLDGQSNSKLPSIPKMKTWWQYWWAVILLSRHVLNLYQFLNVNKKYTFLIVPIYFLKSQRTFATLQMPGNLTIVYVLQVLIILILLLYYVHHREAFIEDEKRKLKKIAVKSCLLKTCAKTLSSVNYVFVLTCKVQFPQNPYYFAFW